MRAEDSGRHRTCASHIGDLDPVPGHAEPAVGAPRPPASDHVHTWPITLRPGADTVTITGTRDGRTFTDTATWTLTSA